MNRKKKIFESSTPLTKEEMEAYLKGDMSQADKYLIDQKIAGNEFNSDAMEGFESTPDAMEGFNELEGQFHGNLPRKVAAKFWRFEFSFILIISVAIGFYFIGHHFLNQIDLDEIKFDETKLTTQVSSDSSSADITMPPIEELNDKEIEDATPLEESKQLTSDRIIIDAPLIMVMDSSINETDKIESAILLINKEKEIISSESDDKKEINQVNAANVISSNIGTLFLSKLLVVDYTKIYNTVITVPNFELTGTTADKENKDDNGNIELDVNTYTQKITYMNFLEKTQLKFRKNKFKDALKDYRTILSHYSNDVNAHFYMALCYFNINKQNKAIEHFDRVLNHDFNTFHEEAKWYKAISLHELGKTSKCITILNEIATENGFYAKKASSMLNKI
jgi:hypothetical protein